MVLLSARSRHGLRLAFELPLQFDDVLVPLREVSQGFVEEAFQGFVFRTQRIDFAAFLAECVLAVLQVDLTVEGPLDARMLLTSRWVMPQEEIEREDPLPRKSRLMRAR